MLQSMTAALTPVSFTQVRFCDDFWTPRIETNRQVTLPHIYDMLVQYGRIAAFDLDFERALPARVTEIFGDSDVAKWIEAVSYALATKPDPRLKALLDGVVERVISAQQPDGYLNTHFIHVQPEMRWKNLRDWHELYCAGHLLEGAVAHAQATGEAALLEALVRYVDLIGATFGPEPGKKPGYCGHPEIELALVKLYRATGEQKYLDLAAFFVDQRGQQPHYYDREAAERGEDPTDFWATTYEYCQAHRPVREQEKVVGHAVRATYLFSAAADLALELGDETLLETCLRLWENLVNRRQYITGGIGPSASNEGFTQDYDLPDETAYAETCATIGLMLWNHRLLQVRPDRRYADALERGLYNGFLSGVSLSGDRFLYENPLSSAGDRQRQPWFDFPQPPCCSSNVARILGSLGSFLYSTGPAGLWVHLYAGSDARLALDGETVRVRQETRYPWDGRVSLALDLEQPQAFTIFLRLPEWCQAWRVLVNGQPLEAQPGTNGYLAVTRHWQNRDVLVFEMEMPVRLTWANPQVRQLEGRAALQRGPLVYCLEGADHRGIILDQISVDPRDTAGSFTAAYTPDLLGGAVILAGKGRLIAAEGWGETLYRSRPPLETEIDLTAVPYCLWGNREPGEMRVWLRTGGCSG
jgi:DUF1680 family protein